MKWSKFQICFYVYDAWATEYKTILLVRTPWRRGILPYREPVRQHIYSNPYADK